MTPGEANGALTTDAVQAPLGRRQRQAAETRLRLFRCALQLFADKGFPNVTVEDITEAADVGKGTFFNYFESKDHVLGVMAEIQLAKVGKAAQAAASGKHSIHSALHHLFLRLAEEPGRSPHLARAVVGSFLARDVVRALIERQISAGRATIAGIIAIGRHAEVAPIHDLRHSASLLSCGPARNVSERRGLEYSLAADGRDGQSWIEPADPRDPPLP
jgi:AcrR family transcriptional regulator